MSKLYQTSLNLLVFTNLHTVLHYLPINEFMVKYPKTFSFSASSCAETLLWQKPLIPAPFYKKRLKHLIVPNPKHVLTHSTMSGVGEETSYGFRWNFCCSSPSHVTKEILFLRLVSVFLSYFLYFSSLVGIRQLDSLLHDFLTSIYLV